jgi:quercetin dioxygenase-like cupin family protein
VKSGHIKSICPLMITIIAILVSLPLNAQPRVVKPKPCLIQLCDTITDYQRVLGGSPQTVSMHSGLVVLSPTKSVGKHSTDNFEEVVIVLAGIGELRITGGETFKLKENSVAYCPPRTEHDVVNTGSQSLRYLYIVAKETR